MTETVSEDAGTLCAGWWGVPIAKTQTVTFGRPQYLTPRAKVALDELVAAGILTEERGRNGAVSYKPSDGRAHEIGRPLVREWLKKPKLGKARSFAYYAPPEDATAPQESTT